MAVVVSSALFADEPQQFAAISTNISLESGTGYFVLSDGSFWKAIPFIKRMRGPLEWWNDVRLVPEQYVTLPKEWPVGLEIAIYSRAWILDVNEENASNQDAIRRCTHLLMNSRTGQFLFAIPFDPASGLAEFYYDVYNEAYKKGHDEGYGSGYSIGYGNGSYNGYAEGYEAATDVNE